MATKERREHKENLLLPSLRSLRSFAANKIMHKRIFIFIVLASFCGGLFAQDKPQDKFLTAQSFKREVTKTIGADYLLFLPKGYDAKSEKRWPLILVLHGAGERGTNVWRVDIHGPTKYLAEHPDFPFIMISPLCPTNETWSNEVLISLLDEVEKKYNVDSERAYLTGLSMGGFGTWSLALSHPERFAAAVPICGGGDALPLWLGKSGYLPAKQKEAIKSLPFWAFHGGKDTVVPPNESQHMIDALKAMGVAEVKLTIYPEATHNSWAETYNNPEVYEWLLQHKRGK